MGCAGHHKGTVWDDIKCLFPLHARRTLLVLSERAAKRHSRNMGRKHKSAVWDVAFPCRQLSELLQ